MYKKVPSFILKTLEFQVHITYKNILSHDFLIAISLTNFNIFHLLLKQDYSHNL